MDTGVLLLIIAAAVGVALYLRRKKGGGNRSQQLREEYRKQLNLSAEKAEPVIERHLSRLKEKFPDKTEEWYLEKMIYDLKRDRR